MSSNVTSADKPKGYEKVTAESAGDLQSAVDVTREAANDLLKRIEAVFGINIKDTAANVKAAQVLNPWLDGTAFGKEHVDHKDLAYAVTALLWLTSASNLLTVSHNLQKVIDSGSLISDDIPF